MCTNKNIVNKVKFWFYSTNAKLTKEEKAVVDMFLNSLDDKNTIFIDILNQKYENLKKVSIIIFRDDEIMMENEKKEILFSLLLVLDNLNQNNFDQYERKLFRKFKSCIENELNNEINYLSYFINKEYEIFVIEKSDTSYDDIKKEMLQNENLPLQQLEFEINDFNLKN